MKHLHFDSIYRPDFEVVEQRQGNCTLYPHTEQLPVLLRALDLEFYGGLPARLARTDHRADDYRKIVLYSLALVYCASVNSTRADGLCLFQLPDRHAVSKISIVQHITEQTRQGPLHSFRFYAGPDFFVDIFLNGKRVFFADHALERFSTRVPSPIGTDLRSFLLFFFGSTIISLRVGPGPALIVPYDPSVLALPFKETEKEIIVTSCLTIHEIHSMELQLPPRAFNHHYDLPYQVPRIRNWIPSQHMIKLFERYERKVPVPPAKDLQPKKKSSWYRTASIMAGIEGKSGYGPNSRIAFVDDLPGPNTLRSKAHEQIIQFDELGAYKKKHPEEDWDAIFAEALCLSPEEARRYCAEPIQT
jgi:hypothetical protein